MADVPPPHPASRIPASSLLPPPDLFNRSIPAPATVIFGSAAWGICMAIAAVIGLYWRDGLIIHSRLAVISLFFYGPAVGFAPGLMLAEWLCGRAGRITRFVVGTIILTLATHTATATIFALQYRMFYAHWHAEFPSITWCFQFAFTSASALYQFTVDSMYVYFPIAPLLFLALGFWFARRAH
ncbi:MAG: hypothetical protein JWM58_647 [Rhizobium sp.]|nr:hypothetical protein [Rhizobium sp.]